MHWHESYERFLRDPYLKVALTARGSGCTVRCPCCGYYTLSEARAYEICTLCWWEDDGQDDPRADEVWGGPNHDYSLTQCRENFAKHLTMYRPEDANFERCSANPELKRRCMQEFQRVSQLRDPSQFMLLLEELNVLVKSLRPFPRHES